MGNSRPTFGILHFIGTGPLVDAPGWVFYIGADGKLHVKRVPGWDPFPDISVAFSVLEQAARLSDHAAAQQLEQVAENILQRHVEPLMKTLEAAARTAEEGTVKG